MHLCMESASRGKSTAVDVRKKNGEMSNDGNDIVKEDYFNLHVTVLFLSPW